MQGKFLRGQAVTAASILSILSNIDQDCTAASDVIGAEDKDSKSAVTPVIFNSPDKVIPLLAYLVLVLAPMKSVANKSNLEYLLRSRHSYTPAQRALLAANIFKDSVTDIAMY